MISSLKNILNSSKSSAKIVDSHLILSLPNATEPIVWRMALDKIGTASFEVKQIANSEQTKLILKPKKGTAEIIAPFETKQEAVDALMQASQALQINTPSAENAVDASTPSAKKTATKTSKNLETQKWIIAILGALIVIGLYYYLTTLIPETTTELGLSSNSVSTTASPQETTGVPVSADDFLNGFQ